MPEFLRSESLFFPIVPPNIWSNHRLYIEVETSPSISEYFQSILFRSFSQNVPDWPRINNSISTNIDREYSKLPLLLVIYPKISNKFIARDDSLHWERLGNKRRRYAS